MGPALALFFFFFGQAVPLAQSPQAMLVVSQKQYGPGETIQFTFTNLSGAPVDLPSPAPWTIWRGSRVVYQPSTSGDLVTLQAGESRTWSISDRVSEFGDLSKSGKYQIHLRFFTSAQTVDIAADFVLVGP